MDESKANRLKEIKQKEARIRESLENNKKTLNKAKSLGNKERQLKEESADTLGPTEKIKEEVPVDPPVPAQNLESTISSIEESPVNPFNPENAEVATFPADIAKDDIKTYLEFDNRIKEAKVSIKGYTNVVVIDLELEGKKSGTIAKVQIVFGLRESHKALKRTRPVEITATRDISNEIQNFVREKLSRIQDMFKSSIEKKAGAKIKEMTIVNGEFKVVFQTPGNKTPASLPNSESEIVKSEPAPPANLPVAPEPVVIAPEIETKQLDLGNKERAVETLRETIAEIIKTLEENRTARESRKAEREALLKELANLNREERPASTPEKISATLDPKELKELKSLKSKEKKIAFLENKKQEKIKEIPEIKLDIQHIRETLNSESLSEEMKITTKKSLEVLESYPLGHYEKLLTAYKNRTTKAESSRKQEARCQSIVDQINSVSARYDALIADLKK